MTRSSRLLLLFTMVSSACAPEVAATQDVDAASHDVAVLETSAIDAPLRDAATDDGPLDVSSLDGPDATAPDVAARDAPRLDAPAVDATLDSVTVDAASLDAMTRDITPIDAAPLDGPDAALDAARDAVTPADAGPSLPAFTTVFSTRNASNAADTAIEDAIVGLINRAVAGSRIRVALFSFTRGRPATALINAFRRGVDVRLVFDGGADSTIGTEVPGLISALGASRVTVCRAPGTACLGTGIMHHKTFLFSALDDGSRDVVVQASHNLTTTQLSMHNNAVIVRGDAALFAAYERTFDDLRRDASMTSYYRVDDGDLATRVYFHPRATGDTAVSILDNVSCDATSRILVAMAFFTDARIEVARSLAARRRAGCAVTVVAGDAEIPLGAGVASTLTAAGVDLVRYPTRGGSWDLHSKYVVIDAPYAGSTTHRHLVFTGSHNWTGPSLDQNDETLLRIEREEVFSAFVADHAHVRASALRP